MSGFISQDSKWIRIRIRWQISVSQDSDSQILKNVWIRVALVLEKVVFFLPRLQSHGMQARVVVVTQLFTLRFFHFSLHLTLARFRSGDRAQS